jgi:hypothetical protein
VGSNRAFDGLLVELLTEPTAEVGGRPRSGKRGVGCDGYGNEIDVRESSVRSLEGLAHFPILDELTSFGCSMNGEL